MNDHEPFDDLVRANRSFAESYAVQAPSGWAQKGLAILTCIDTRIEPLGMLGLRPGDAKILRNAGARVTDDVIRSLALATRFLGVHRIAVVQHTDCRVASATPDEVAEHFRGLGVDPGATDFLLIDDQHAAMRADLDRLRSSELIGPVALGAFLYDVHTGLLAPVPAD